MLHSKKSQSIVIWFNSLTTKGNVKSLPQFADGSHFFDIVANISAVSKLEKKSFKDEESNTDPYPLNILDSNVALNEEVITSVEESASEEMETENKGMPVTESAEIVCKDNEGTDTEKKYDAIKQFINDFYHMDSTLLVNYADCINGKELELAKVAVLLLSALVQQLLSSSDEGVYNTTLLEAEVQEDIRECLSLVLVEKDDAPVKKTEFHKILSRPATCIKGTPRRSHLSRGTPDVNESLEAAKGVPKKRERKDRSSVFVYEDGPGSPLRSLLESPKIQYKAALYRKDSELSKLRSDLHAEEFKVDGLTLENQSLKNELTKTKREMENLKEQYRKYREDTEETESITRNENKQQNEERNKLQELNQRQKEEIKHLQKELEESRYDYQKLQEKNKFSKSHPVSDIHRHELLELRLQYNIKKEEVSSLEKQVEELEKKNLLLEEAVGRSNEIDHGKSPALRKRDSDLETLLVEEREKTRNLEKSLKKAEEERTKIKNMWMHAQNIENSLRTNLVSYKKCLDALDAIGMCDVCMEKWNSTKRSEDVSDNIDTETVASIEEPPNHAMLCSDEDLNLMKKVILSIYDLILKKKLVTNRVLLNKKKAAARSVESFKGIIVILAEVEQTLEKASPAVSGGRRSRSQTKDESDVILAQEREQRSLLERENKKLKIESEKTKKDLQNARDELQEKSSEIKVLGERCQNLESTRDALQLDLENTHKKASTDAAQYKSSQQQLEKLKVQNKKLLYMYRHLMKNSVPSEQPKPASCQECENMRRELKEAKNRRRAFELNAEELKAVVKNLEGKMQNLDHQVKTLEKEKKELEFKMRGQKAFLSGSTSERNSVILQYFKQGLDEAKQKIKVQETAKKEAQFYAPQPVVRVNTYILNGDRKESFAESSMSKSFANRSVRSDFCQVADEEDFLNHSSLAEIHNGGIPDDSRPEDRLQELRRRNTLCLPHLQSSYPLEIQNMTPSEKKYYYAQREERWQPRQKTFVSEAERRFYREQEAQFMGLDYSDDDSGESIPCASKKRKANEMDISTAQSQTRGEVSVSSSSGISHPSSSGVAHPSSSDISRPRKKFRTPVRLRGIINRTGSIRTPLGIRKLMHKRKDIKK